MCVKITYLSHSGFCIKTKCHTLVFDYYLDTPKNGGLLEGVINPRELTWQNVIVFCSHRHQDHFNQNVFAWKKEIKNLRFVLSDDIDTKENALLVAPGETYYFSDFTLRTLRSTDEGCAFLIHIDGICIYHAGDLNWWHWDGEPDAENDAMGEAYRREISILKGEAIDVALIPVDPRLERTCLWGIRYFMETVGANVVFPIHFWENYEVFQAISQDEVLKKYSDKIMKISHRGQSIILD